MRRPGVRAPHRGGVAPGRGPHPAGGGVRVEPDAAALPRGTGSRPPPRVPPAQCSCARPSLYSGRGSPAFRTQALQGGSNSGVEPWASGAAVRVSEPACRRLSSVAPSLSIFISHPPPWSGLHIDSGFGSICRRGSVAPDREGASSWVSEGWRIYAGRRAGVVGTQGLRFSRSLLLILRLSQVRAAPSTTMAAAWIPALCLGGYAPLTARFPSRQAAERLELALVLSSLRRCLSAAAAAAGVGEQPGSR